MKVDGNRVAFRHWLGAKALLGLRWYARRIPEERVPAAGDRVGMLMRAISPRHARLVLTNLRLALGKERSEEDLQAIALQSYRYGGRSLLEFLRMPYMTKEQIEAKVTLVNTKYLDEALARGKGCILLTAHYGNWELVGARLAAAGYPMNVIARSQRDPKVTDLLTGVREKVGMRVIDRDQGAKGALRALRRNGIVAILLDQNAGTNGVFVDFFGLPAATATGPAALARATGAAVAPIFSRREPDNHHIGECLPLLELQFTDDKASDDVRNTQRMVALIEEHIRLRPEQWFWMHKRWKTRPPDHPEPVYHE